MPVLYAELAQWVIAQQNLNCTPLVFSGEIINFALPVFLPLSRRTDTVADFVAGGDEAGRGDSMP